MKEPSSKNKYPSSDDIIKFYQSHEKSMSRPNSYSDYYNAALKHYQKQDITFVELCEFADFYKPLNGTHEQSSSPHS